MTDAEILTLVDRLERCLLAKKNFIIAIIWLWPWCICIPQISKRR